MITTNGTPPDFCPGGGSAVYFLFLFLFLFLFYFKITANAIAISRVTTPAAIASRIFW